MNAETPGTPDLRWEGGSPDGLGGKEWTTTRPEVVTPGTPAATWPTEVEESDFTYFDETTDALHMAAWMRNRIARQVAAREAAAYERGRAEAEAGDLFMDGYRAGVRSGENASPSSLFMGGLIEGRKERDAEVERLEFGVKRRDANIAALRERVAALRVEVAEAEQRGAEQARAELADRYLDQLRRQETVHDTCEGHALCDLVSELTTETPGTPETTPRPGLSGPDEFPAGGAENSCCADCRQPYTVWSADNDLWNAVMRPNGEQEDEPFLCARCFLIRAQPVTEFADVVWPKYPSRRDRARAAAAES